MAIKMTTEEYKAKYGEAPVFGKGGSQPTQSNGLVQNLITNPIKNAFTGGINQVKEGYSQFEQSNGNPVTALEGITKSLAGGVGAAFSPLAPLTTPFSEGVNQFANTVGEARPLQNFATSPAGKLTSRAVEDISNVNTIAGAVVGGMGGAKVAGNVASKAPEAITPVINSAGRILKGTGEGAYGITVPPTEATAKALISYDAKQPNLIGRVKNFITGDAEGVKPITEANTAARKGLMGTEYQLGVQARKVSNDLWNTVISPKLDEVQGKVNMKGFFDQVEKQIVKDTKELGRRNALKEALNSLREQYQKVSKVDLRKLQEYKEGWAKFLPDSSYKGKPIGAALKEVQNIAAGKARDIIYKHIGEEGKMAYLDYGNLKSIIESGAKSITGDLAKKSLSRDIWQTVMDKAITPVATIAGKVLYKTGEGLELVGQKGAKKVGDVVGTKDIPTMLPKDNQPLLQEALKYKSAEEFVKAQDIIYRGEGGSNVAQGKALLAEGKHYASDSAYPQGFGKVGEYVIKPDVKVLDLGDSTFAEISNRLGIPERKYISPTELSTIAKEKGYDVLKYNGEYMSSGKPFTHTVDLTGNSIISKSQLTDIWKNANNKK